MIARQPAARARQGVRGGLARSLRAALLHYAIGRAAEREGAPVDWRYVARRMAESLSGSEEERGAAS